MMAWFDELKYDEQGLIPAIAQDHQSGDILMMAWMNKEAVQLTQEKQQAVYWSRSRQKLWFKGEESGHVQLLKEMRIDCDADVVLLAVEQKGGIACHTGRKRCFYRVLDSDQWNEDEPVLKNPDEIYS
ncbi:MAG: phosphoribosyl-AMP cyclohydrolase [Gammaproteobacteria bacterium]|nr:phosphoribosyl-AMP cyclohydrolase [Gammaproteobacteria bacterium]